MNDLREPNQEIVETLETLLDSALVGDLQGLALALTYCDGRIRTAWKGTALEDRFRVLGGLVYLGYRILKESIDEEAADDPCDEDEEVEGP